MSKTRPHVVIVTTHDTGRHLGCYGNRSVNSPTLDGIAADGFRAASFFSTGAVCSPSRAAMMSGLYPQHNGVMGLTHEPWLWEYSDPSCHLSHRLRQAGYQTVLFHHQHEARDRSSLGFDEEHAKEPDHPDGAMPDPYAHIPCDRVAAEFARYVAEDFPEDRPLYAQIGFFETHDPLDFGGTEPDDAQGVELPGHLSRVPDQEAMRRKLAMLQGSVKKVDAAVATIYEALRKRGVADDTLFVFTVDHGMALPKAKAHLYDAGIGVALIMRWPGGVVSGGKVFDGLLSNVDLTPTILDLVGVDVPGDIDGRSFRRQIADPSLDSPRDAVFAQMTATGHPRDCRCIRTDRFKLIRNFNPTRLKEMGPEQGFRTCPPVQLFDLVRDPDEFDDVADDPSYRQTRDELDRRLVHWMREVDDPILKGPICAPFYRQAMSTIPADWLRPEEPHPVVAAHGASS